MKDSKFIITNKVVIPCIIALALLLWAAVYLIDLSRSAGDTVYIYQDGRLVQEIKLSYIAEPYTIDLGTNKVRVQPEGVSMESAHCPDKLCVKQGSISKSGESIICLPNKIIIEFKGSDGEVDAVTR